MLPQQGLGRSVASAGIMRQCCLSRDWKTGLPQQGLGGSVASAGIGRHYSLAGIWRQCCLNRDLRAVFSEQGVGKTPLVCPTGSVASARKGLGGSYLKILPASFESAIKGLNVVKCSKVEVWPNQGSKISDCLLT